MQQSICYVIAECRFFPEKILKSEKNGHQWSVMRSTMGTEVQIFHDTTHGKRMRCVYLPIIISNRTDLQRWYQYYDS
jgi:hypothetical protein